MVWDRIFRKAEIYESDDNLDLKIEKYRDSNKTTQTQLKHLARKP